MLATLTFSGDAKSIAGILARLNTDETAELVVHTPPAKVAAVDSAPKRGRGRPSKEEVAARAAKEAEAEADDLGFETEDEEAEEVEEVSDEEAEEAEEEEAPPVERKGAKKAKAYDLNKDIIPAFQKYAKDHSREKAAKVLSKFKAAKVSDLDPKHYGEVIKLLAKG